MDPIRSPAAPTARACDRAHPTSMSQNSGPSCTGDRPRHDHRASMASLMLTRLSPATSQTVATNAMKLILRDHFELDLRVQRTAWPSAPPTTACHRAGRIPACRWPRNRTPRRAGIEPHFDGVPVTDLGYGTGAATGSGFGWLCRLQSRGQSQINRQSESGRFRIAPGLAHRNEKTFADRGGSSAKVRNEPRLGVPCLTPREF